MKDWSTTWRIGDGTMISFWYDSWGNVPLRNMRDGLPRPIHQNASLREALPIIADLGTDLVIPSHVRLNEGEDELIWRWSPNGRYSANSFYKILLGGGKVRWRFIRAWKCYAPLKAKIFAFLVLKGRILTHDLMERRGLMCDMRCVLCAVCQVEDALHLLFNCSYAVNVWMEISALLGWNLMVTGNSIEQIWDKSWSAARRAGSECKGEWTTRFICVLWCIWKQRNAIIFRNERLPSQLLAVRIKEESDLWINFCKGNGSSFKMSM